MPVMIANSDFLDFAGIDDIQVMLSTVFAHFDICMACRLPGPMSREHLDSTYLPYAEVLRGLWRRVTAPICMIDRGFRGGPSDLPLLEERTSRVIVCLVNRRFNSAGRTLVEL